LQAPTTVTSQKQLSPLGQITTLGNTLQGGLTALGNTAAGASLLKSLGLSGIVPGSSSSTSSGTSTGGVNTTGQGQTTVALPVDPSWGAPVAGTGANGGAGAGQILGTDGNVYNDPSYGTNAGGLDTGIYGPTPSGSNIDLQPTDTTVTDTQQQYGV